MSRLALRRQRRHWDDLARLNPLDSILARFHRPGEWTLEEFFLEGEREIDNVLRFCDRLGIPIRFGRALDFGCGVGRLSRALAARFDYCHGVDVSPAMLERARELNGHIRNLRFEQTADALSTIADGSFDFIYSARVLQHVPQKALVAHYIREFIRVLRPGGVAVFQLPTYIPWRHRIQPRARLYGALRLLGVPESVLYWNLRLTPMRMMALAPDRVRRILATTKASVLHVDEPPPQPPEYPSGFYFTTKR